LDQFQDQLDQFQDQLDQFQDQLDQFQDQLDQERLHVLEVQAFQVLMNVLLSSKCLEHHFQMLVPLPQLAAVVH
jgi:prefoldin subunit 5